MFGCLSPPAPSPTLWPKRFGAGCVNLKEDGGTYSETDGKKNLPACSCVYLSVCTTESVTEKCGGGGSICQNKRVLLSLLVGWTVTYISAPSYCLTCLSSFGAPSLKHPSFSQYVLEILVNSCRQKWWNWVRFVGFVAPTHYSNSSSHRFSTGMRSQLCVLTQLSFSTFCNKPECTWGHFPLGRPTCDQTFDFLVNVMKYDDICHLYSDTSKWHDATTPVCHSYLCVNLTYCVLSLFLHPESLHCLTVVNLLLMNDFQSF